MPRDRLAHRPAWPYQSEIENIARKNLTDGFCDGRLGQAGASWDPPVGSKADRLKGIWAAASDKYTQN
jgi:hypothetical protein